MAAPRRINSPSFDPEFVLHSLRPSGQRIVLTRSTCAALREGTCETPGLHEGAHETTERGRDCRASLRICY